MAKQNIPNRHLLNDAVHTSSREHLPTFLCGERAQSRIQQYDTDFGHLKRVLLIDFQSVYKLCRMACPEFHSLLSFFLAFSKLCTGRGEARSALTKRDKEIIAAKQKWRCGVCKELFDESGRYEVDHGVALSLGGRNNESNLWALCITCHKEITEKEMSYPLKPL
ncbi:MAG: HNH endonuclease [Promethearchaeota archaeon]